VAGRERGDTARLIREQRRQLEELRREIDRLRRDLEPSEHERGRLERERDGLPRERDRLRDELEAARRAAKRQAAPFSKGAPTARPQRPGRKAGPTYGARARRHKDRRAAGTRDEPSLQEGAGVPRRHRGAHLGPLPRARHEALSLARPRALRAVRRRSRPRQQSVAHRRAADDADAATHPPAARRLNPLVVLRGPAARRAEPLVHRTRGRAAITARPVVTTDAHGLTAKT